MPTLDPLRLPIDRRALPPMPGPPLAHLCLTVLAGGWPFLWHCRRPRPTLATPTVPPLTKLRRLALLGFLSEHQGLQSFETQLRLAQGKEQPEIKGEHLDQHPSVLGGQGIPFEAGNQRFAVFATQRDFFGTLHRALHSFGYV